MRSAGAGRPTGGHRAGRPGAQAPGKVVEPAGQPDPVEHVAELVVGGVARPIGRFSAMVASKR